MPNRFTFGIRIPSLLSILAVLQNQDILLFTAFLGYLVNWAHLWIISFPVPCN